MMSLKDLKLGQLLGWRFMDKSRDESRWTCVTKVSGFHKITKYPNQNNGLVYVTNEKINHKVVAQLDDSWDVSVFMLNVTQKDEMETGYTYQREFWEAWLLEDEHDYLDVIKHIMAEKL